MYGGMALVALNISEMKAGMACNSGGRRRQWHNIRRKMAKDSKLSAIKHHRIARGMVAVTQRAAL